MISVIATVVFFIMLFEAFYFRRVPENDFQLAVSAIYPKGLFVTTTTDRYPKVRAYVRRVNPQLFTRLVVVDDMKDVAYPAPSFLLTKEKLGEKSDFQLWAEKIMSTVRHVAVVSSPYSMTGKNKYFNYYVGSNPPEVLGTPTHHSNFTTFQTPATPIMEGIVDLHNDIMFFLAFIIVFCFYLLFVCTVEFAFKPGWFIDRY